MRVIGRGPSRLTSQFCKQCQVTASKFIGGAEIEVTLLFADVRGSTSLAEQMSTSEFSVGCQHKWDRKLMETLS